MCYGFSKLLSHAAAAALFPLPGAVLAITAEITVKAPLQLAPAASAAVAVPPACMARELHAVLESGIGADVKLLCAGQSFPANSVILSIRSPVFAALLDAGSPLAAPDRGAVPVPGEVTPATLARLLEFIYTDDLDPAPSAEEARPRRHQPSCLIAPQAGGVCAVGRRVEHYAMLLLVRDPITGGGPAGGKK